jgi:acetyl-CoA decarbonylase/synthase, CODH/ACS complex subunit beta
VPLVGHNEKMEHTHGAGLALTPKQRQILINGLNDILESTIHFEYLPLPSKRYPLPLTGLPYSSVPTAESVRAEVRTLSEANPMNALEQALALLELFEVNREDTVSEVLDDMEFTGTAFSSKRANGWTAVLGDADSNELEESINAKWRFRFFRGTDNQAGLYLLLNALARYAFVYGKATAGDAHGASHFIEDHTPGLIICRGKMSDLEITLALMAMKMGVPAIVPRSFPLPFGKQLQADSLEEIGEAVTAFPNIRRALDHPNLVDYPDYVDPEHVKDTIESCLRWGDNPASFFTVQKGHLTVPRVVISGTPDEPSNPLGIIVTIDAEPMDAVDRKYIEEAVPDSISMIPGVGYERGDGRLTIVTGPDAESWPGRVGEMLQTAVRYQFPRITSVSVEVIFDEKRLRDLAPGIEAERNERLEAIRTMTEDSVEHFLSCVGCSQFAPDHVCIITPERPPMCGRTYGKIKTGALYSYDDMTNIHHTAMYRMLNSYSVFEKGDCLDPARGEWDGVNRRIGALSKGRTDRVFLHSLDDFPHTGCGCFGLILFRLSTPQSGIGIMARGDACASPDGRTWEDLYYDQAGKQNPGSTGASKPYLRSPKFLSADGGWDSIVWMSPKVVEFMGDDIPAHVDVG